MKNYYEHETKVKFSDGLLGLSKDWQWFIDQTETDFQGFTANTTTWVEFLNSYHDISDVYAHLVSIHNIGDINITINKPWLKIVNSLALFFCEKASFHELWDSFTDEFSKLLLIVIYVTKILNYKNTGNYIFSIGVFQLNNYFQLNNLDDLKEKKEDLIERLNSLSYSDKRTWIDCFENNLNEVIVPANLSLLETHRNEIVAADAFNYRRINHPNNISWEEQYIFDMLNTKVDDGKLRPAIIFSDRTTPDMSLWTEDVLNSLIDYFNCDISSFVIETVRYYLYNHIPSEQTIAKHFELIIEHLKTVNDDTPWYKIECSSLLTITALINGKMVSDSIKKRYMRDFVAEVGKLSSPKIISHLKNIGCTTTKEQTKLLKDYNDSLASGWTSIKKSTDFWEYCRNEFVIQGQTTEVLESVVDVFQKLIDEEESVALASLFHEFLIFLLKQLQNPNVEKRIVKQLLIGMQRAWQGIYYEKCLGKMHSIKTPLEIKKETVDISNALAVNKPSTYVRSIISLTEDRLVEKISLHSELVFSSLFTSLIISKSFPYERLRNVERHDTDQAFLSIIENILETKSYKFLNQMKPMNMLNAIYDDMIQSVLLSISLFSDEKALYEKLKTELFEYKLIDLNDEIYLAHVTQLFPILENKIREYGSYLSIVPFKEKPDEYIHQKDPSSVLQDIILEIYKETSSLENIPDLFFVYQCMYNDNFLNVRNECAHGNAFIFGGELLNGFKLTMICLNVILEKLNYVKALLEEA